MLNDKYTVTEDTNNTQLIHLVAPDARLITEHLKPQSVQVLTEGLLKISFTHQYKIKHFEMTIKEASEFVARKTLGNMKLGTQDLLNNSTCWGLPKKMLEFLKMANILEGKLESVIFMK